MGQELIPSQSLENRLLFAVPKKGRLLSASLNLFEGADIQFRRENRLDIALVKNLPIALVFLPAADIPTFVGEGRVDLGITGYDQVQEHDARVEALRRDNGTATAALPTSRNGLAGVATGCEKIMDLAFGACKLQIQVPAKGAYASPRDLIGKNIGTSFVHLARKYFARLEREVAGIATVDTDAKDSWGRWALQTKIIKLSGSVEAACALGVADGIVDLVESGETMKAAGLKAIDTVVDSEAILIRNINAPGEHASLTSLVAARINGVITAQRYVLCQYNVARSKLPEATKITPGKRAPTVNSLEEKGWVAVSAMVEKKKMATVMDQLMAVGATDILILDIKNTRGS